MSFALDELQTNNAADQFCGIETSVPVMPTAGSEICHRGTIRAPPINPFAIGLLPAAMLAIRCAAASTRESAMAIEDSGIWIALLRGGPAAIGIRSLISAAPAAHAIPRQVGATTLA